MHNIFIQPKDRVVEKMDQKEKKVSLKIPEDIHQLVTNYSISNNIDFEEAVIELLKKGYEYSELEKKYDKYIHDREVWDRRYYFLKVESAYVYYRLKLRDIYEEMKSLAMTLSSVLSTLEHLLQRYGIKDQNMDNYLDKMHATVKYYLDQYVLASRKEENSPEINDAEVIQSIEETLQKYKSILGREQNNTSER